MAFRIPHNLLTEEHKIKIKKDLTLVEKKNWHTPKLYSKRKEITFYSVDVDTKEIFLPMHYAGELLKTPLINRCRIYHKVPSFEFTTKLYDYQEEVVNISMKNFSSKGTTFLNVFCSYGKTVVAAYFAAMFAKTHGLLTLVTYPRVLIGKSWIGTFRKLTTAKIFIVGEDKEFTPDVNVILCMNTRLPNLDINIRRKVGHFVIDEAHLYCTTSHVQCLLAIEPMCTTVLTATYERDDGFHTMLDFLVGSERITRISKKPFFVFYRPTPFEVTLEYNSFGVIYRSIIKQLDNNLARNSLILQTVMDNLSEKILIITTHVPHAKSLASWLEHYLKPLGKTVALLAGNINQYHDSDVLVGTKSKIGVGFDEKESCLNWGGRRINMLIALSIGKKIEQIAGRAFRAKYPFVVDIVDNNPQLNNHWNLRKKWYASRNGIIYEMNHRFCWKDLFPIALQNYMSSLNDTTFVNTEMSSFKPLQDNGDCILQKQSNSLVRYLTNK